MEDQKRRQIEYHEAVHYRADAPRVADDRHPYVAWLNQYRLRKAIEMMGTPLAGKSVLSVCGGDGQEGDFFARLGAHVTVSDISTVALEAARRRNPALSPVRMDAENLDYPDRSFDWVVVRDGLHHLARPIRGFYELERVSRDGFVVLEGQDSPAVRVLAWAGLAENRDPAGGYVYRFSRRELYKLFSSMQSVSGWTIHTAWLPFGSDLVAMFPWFRRTVYPQLQRPWVNRTLAWRPVRVAFRTVFDLCSFALGRWGNSLIVVAHKDRPGSVA